MTRDTTDVRQRLVAAMAQARLRWAGAELEVLPDSGLAHAHVRLVGHGALARIPKQSQMDFAPAANLAYQAACFERAARSDHTPALLGVLAPSDMLPRGALIVEEIIGRTARLPHDMTAIMTALARIHQLPLPAQDACAPLTAAADPLLDLLAEIEAQAAHLDAAQADPIARRRIDAEIERYRAPCAQPPRPPRCLISFDAHPGNFMIRVEGCAVLVDLEMACATAKCDVAVVGYQVCEVARRRETDGVVGRRLVDRSQRTGTDRARARPGRPLSEHGSRRTGAGRDRRARADPAEHG